MKRPVLPYYELLTHILTSTNFSKADTHSLQTATVVGKLL
jgi:hypothetical protein